MTETAVRTLGDIATWYSGGTPKAGTQSYYGGDIRWAVIADLNDRTVADTAMSITEEGLAVIGGRVAPVDAVMVSMYGTIGRVGLAGRPMATNQAIAWGVVDRTAVLPQFLMLWLQHNRESLDALGRGATQRNINREIIRAFPVPVPPLAEQGRIVDLISAADATISASMDIAGVAGACAAAVVTEAIEAADSLMSLGNVAVTKGGKRLPKGTPWAGHPTQHPYIRVVDMKDGRIKDDALVHVPEEVWPSIQRYVVDAQDVIISIVGTIGEVALVPAHLAQANLTENAALIRAQLSLHPAFLTAYLRSERGQAEIKRLTVGTTQAKLALFRIRSIQVPNLPRERQQAVAALHDAMRDVALAAESQATSLRTLRTSLLAVLLSGDAELPASYDRFLDGAA